MRLIDADELIYLEYEGLSFVPKDFIDDAQTIEIVRCKDCEYFIQGKIHGLCDIHCNGAGECEVVKKDAFCSYGKRAEGKRRRMLDSGMVVKE